MERRSFTGLHEDDARELVEAIGRDLDRIMSHRRARLRETVGIGFGDGADALAILVCRCPSRFTAVILDGLKRTWVRSAEPRRHRINGQEVLIPTTQSGLATSLPMRAMLDDAGALSFTKVYSGERIDFERQSRSWLCEPLNGIIEEYDNG